MKAKTIGLGLVAFIFCLVVSLNIDMFFSSFSSASKELLTYGFIALGIFSLAAGGLID